MSKKFVKANDVDLMVVGIRKAEGGSRAGAYHNCFSHNDKTCDIYRPVFWYKDNDKKDYEEHFNITHSRCYTEYGFKRTGCSCCPFGREYLNELEIAKEKEPKLYKAVTNIFGKSYEYTNEYKKFAQAKNNEAKYKEEHNDN